MESAKMKNVVWLVVPADVEVTRQYCQEVGKHWPHAVRVKMMHLQGEPEVVTVCPGSGGRGLMIAQRVGRGEHEWMVQDADGQNRIDNMMRALEEGMLVIAHGDAPVEVEKYAGTRRQCGDRTPHLPHVLDEYSTVRYGQLVRYCPGWSGDGLDIYEDRWDGDAQVPDQSVIFVVRS
jgi:hypothetical protein